MKLSEIKGEQALDVLADLLEPVAEIMSDKKVSTYFQTGSKLKAVKTAIKEHKKAVIEILAVMDGEDPETYQPKVITLPMRFIEFFNDEDFVSLFPSQTQNIETSSGSATESTGEEDQ